MKRNEILQYLHNWDGLLNRRECKQQLVSLYKSIRYFDFSVVSYLHAEGDAVHVYPGISDDYQNVRFFVLAERFDREAYRDEIQRYIYTARPKDKTVAPTTMNAEISTDEAQQRIQWWEDAFSGALADGIHDETLKIRCFVIPIEDIVAERNRAHFALKKAANGKYAIDLIIRGLKKSAEDESYQEVSESYDTIRLVPPFPPLGKEKVFDLLYH